MPTDKGVARGCNTPSHDTAPPIPPNLLSTIRCVSRGSHIDSTPPLSHLEQNSSLHQAQKLDVSHVDKRFCQVLAGVCSLSLKTTDGACIFQQHTPTGTAPPDQGWFPIDNQMVRGTSAKKEMTVHAADNHHIFACAGSFSSTLPGKE